MSWIGRTPRQRAPPAAHTVTCPHRQMSSLPLPRLLVLAHSYCRRLIPGRAPASPGRDTGPSDEGKKLQAKTLTQQMAEGVRKPGTSRRSADLGGGGLRGLGRSPGAACPTVWLVWAASWRRSRKVYRPSNRATGERMQGAGQVAGRALPGRLPGRGRGPSPLKADAHEPLLRRAQWLDSRVSAPIDLLSRTVPAPPSPEPGEPRRAREPERARSTRYG